MDQPQALCFVLSVWNDTYVDLYLNYALPSQLADGNLNAIKNSQNVYCIYTRASDKLRIESSPIYQKLQSLITVRFSLIDESISDNRLRAGHCFGLGVAFAKTINAAVVLVMPDVLFSAGSFKYMQKQLQQGYRAILLACHTTETAKAYQLLQKHLSQDGVIHLSGRDCVDILMSSMHVNSQEKFYLETPGNLMPACLCWSVGTQGILTHAFHLTPLAVFPRDMEHQFLGTIDREFILEANIYNDEILVVQDSDDCCMFEMALENHIVTSTYRRGNPDDVIDWAIIHANTQHRSVFSTAAHLKSNQYNENSQQWLEVELQANVVVEYVEKILSQRKFSLAHYIKFRYAYLRKFLLTAHTLEWQQKPYKGQWLGKVIVGMHKRYLKIAATFASLQSKKSQGLLEKINYWPNKIGNKNIPLSMVVQKFEQWALNNNSPMLIQMLFFPIKYPAMWFGVSMFNLLVGGLQIVRN